MKMADNKYNLDSIISKYIHRPILKASDNLPPLYARTGSESESQSDLEGMSNPLWQKAVQVRYNSPTNVRRLFISDNGVSIQYFQPPFNANEASGGNKYWATYSFLSDEKLSTMAYNVLNYNQLVMDAAMRNASKPDRTVVTKTGLGALSNNWKMSNVEEIYITPSILVSEDIRNRFQTAESVYMAFQANPTGKLFNDELPLRIFEYANGSNIKDIRSRFPRLRTVAFATNLDKVLEVPKITSLREGLPAETSELGLKWFKHAAKFNIQGLTSLMVADVPFESKAPCVEFAIRPGIYKFDATVLQPFVDKYKAKVTELGRQQRDALKNIIKEEAKAAKSEYERMLDSICETKGDTVVAAAIQLTFARSTKDEIDKVFSEMSSEGNQKYRKMLGR